MDGSCCCGGRVAAAIADEAVIRPPAPQIFHLLIVLAAYVHYEASVVLIRWRHMHQCPSPA